MVDVFLEFKQLSYDSCISVRLGQVAPDKPLPLTFRLRLLCSQSERKGAIFVSGVGVAGREWAGRGWRLQVRKSWLLLTSLPYSLRCKYKDIFNVRILTSAVP